jgi:hypothetical protein
MTVTAPQPAAAFRPHTVVRVGILRRTPAWRTPPAKAVHDGLLTVLRTPAYHEPGEIADSRFDKIVMSLERGDAILLPPFAANAFRIRITRAHRRDQGKVGPVTVVTSAGAKKIGEEATLSLGEASELVLIGCAAFVPSTSALDEWMTLHLELRRREDAADRAAAREAARKADLLM